MEPLRFLSIVLTISACVQASEDSDSDEAVYKPDRRWFPGARSAWSPKDGVQVHYQQFGPSGSLMGSSTSEGKVKLGDPCQRETKECEAVWTYSGGKRVKIDLICYQGRCECPHPVNFWPDPTTKTCRRKAGAAECDIQSDDTCVPGAICVMDQIFQHRESDANPILNFLFTTKCYCKAGCGNDQTRAGLCTCPTKQAGLSNGTLSRL